MIEFIEYTQTRVDEKSLTLFFDAPGNAWIRRQALIDVFGIKKSIVQKLMLPKAATQSPQGAYVIQWQQAVEFLNEVSINISVMLYFPRPGRCGLQPHRIVQKRLKI